MLNNLDQYMLGRSIELVYNRELQASEGDFGAYFVVVDELIIKVQYIVRI
jgi:hypothetical protein